MLRCSEYTNDKMYGDEKIRTILFDDRKIMCGDLKALFRKWRTFFAKGT